MLNVCVAGDSHAAGRLAGGASQAARASQARQLAH